MNLPTEDNIEPLSVTVKTAARITGLGESTIWSLIASGDIKCARVGRRTLPYMADIKALLGISSNNNIGRERPAA